MLTLIVGIGVGWLPTLRTDKEARDRADREETGRALRWSVEIAIDRPKIGGALLEALERSHFLRREDRRYVRDAARAVLGYPGIPEITEDRP
jgi:hypothetical protein